MSVTSFELNDQIVRAGAGAGKTTRLTGQVVEMGRRFKEKEGRWPRLIVTTFTRKATQELRERLILLACREQDPELLDFVSSPSLLHISTLHGVFSLFLKRYGHLVDLDSGFSLMADQEADLLAKKVLRDEILVQGDSQNLLDWFRFDQLTQMVRRYLEASLDDSQLALASLSKMEDLYRDRLKHWGKEFQEVQEEILAEATNDSWRSFGESLSKVRKQLQSSDPLPSGFEIVETIRELGRKPTFSKKKPPVSEEVAERLKLILGQIKGEMESPAFQPDHWLQWQEAFDLFEGLAQRFSEKFVALKEEQGKFEMSDLELFTWRAVQREPRVAQAFSEDWDYWLVDEYQDTSPLQVRILKSLIQDRPSFVVGDPQQSIYLFRGARSEVFFEKEKELAESEGARQVLMKNYRSQPELLLFFNDFFSGLEGEFMPMEPRSSEELMPQKVVARFCVGEECFDEGKSKDQNEKDAIVCHILTLLAQGAEPEDICILARTNRTLAQLAPYLNTYGIATHVHAAAGFYDRREIIDALALLKFFINSHDNENLIRLLRSPWCRVSDQQLVEWVCECKNQKKTKVYWSVFKEKPVESVIRLNKFLAQSEKEGLSATYGAALVELGFIDLSHFHDTSGRRESNLWKLLTKLKSEERKPGFNPLNFVANSFVTLSESKGGEENDAVAALEPNCVNLMTIHASKGLQFKHLIVPQIGKKIKLSGSGGREALLSVDEVDHIGSFPLPFGEDQKLAPSLVDMYLSQKKAEWELAESDRLLYVALTRAIETVMLSWTDPHQALSWVERIKWDLTPGVHQRENYTYIVDRGPWSPQKISVTQSESSSVRAPFEDLNVDFGLNQMSNGGHRFSVSELLANQSQKTMSEVKELAVEDLHRRAQSAADGTLIHRVLEVLKSRPEFGQGSELKKWFGLRSAEVGRAIEFVKDLEEPPLREIISDGFVEWGFQLPTSQGILEGQIDLWGTTQHKGELVTWIIDYKSGLITHKEKAFDQLSLYTLALRRYGVQGELRMAVLYPLAQEVEIRKAPLEAEVVRRFLT